MNLTPVMRAYADGPAMLTSKPDTQAVAVGHTSRAVGGPPALAWPAQGVTDGGTCLFLVVVGRDGRRVAPYLGGEPLDRKEQRP